MSYSNVVEQAHKLSEEKMWEREVQDENVYKILIKRTGSTFNTASGKTRERKTLMMQYNSFPLEDGT